MRHLSKMLQWFMKNKNVLTVNTYGCAETNSLGILHWESRHKYEDMILPAYIKIFGSFKRYEQ